MRQRNEESLWKAVLDGQAAEVNAILASLDRKRNRKVLDQAPWYAVRDSRAEEAKVHSMLLIGSPAK